MIWIPNQLIGAALGNDVTLECITEAMPKAISYWVYNTTMVMTSGRFRTHEHHHSNYKLDLKLHIQNISKGDFGQYKCLSKNSHGDNEGTIMLYGNYRVDLILNNFNFSSGLPFWLYICIIASKIFFLFFFFYIELTTPTEPPVPTVYEDIQGI